MNHSGFFRDEDTAEPVPVLRGTMPLTPLRLLPIRTTNAVGFMPRLIRRDRDQLAGHQPALVRVQIERATFDGVDADRMRLHEIDEIFQLARLPIKPIHMPRHDPSVTELHPFKEIEVAGAFLVSIRGDIVIHKHGRVFHTEPVAKGEAVLPLPLNPGLRARAILADAQIDDHLLHAVVDIRAVHDDLHSPGRYVGQTRHVDKTTAMNALRRAGEAEHGSGSVVGLAPSAVAAQVLADDLGIATENTAKWWQNHLIHGTTFEARQLVIIDEASLAGALSLDRITHLAHEAGAKVLLVGDYAQLQSVDAGGAFAMIARDRADTPELVDVHRFTHVWEKTASLELRHGRTATIDTYLAHQRITDGDGEAMTDAAYNAWRTDRDAGLVSVLIAETHQDLTVLNGRARADLILNKTLNPDREVELRDGTAAGVGDTIITRLNNRNLRTLAGRDWVRNGDIWTVTAVGDDGTITIARDYGTGTTVRDDGTITAPRRGRRLGGSILLPAAYVAEHVDLGYAVTAYRAQGITTATAHVLVKPTSTRETFYVAMTRGRHSIHAYVTLDRADDHAQPHPGDDPHATARSVLYGVLQHSGAELSAHETIVAEQEQWGSIAQLAAEYETIAAAAQHDRWATLIRGAGLTDELAESAIESDAFGPLAAELRRAEANHHNLNALLPRLVAARGFIDADAIAAVLHYRVARATARPAGSGRTRPPPQLIAGLIPQANRVADAEMRAALDEREALIEARVDAVLDGALTESVPWTRALGAQPNDRRRAAIWRKAARVVAAYRDRYRITDDAPLGARPESTAQKIDAARARAAVIQADEVARAHAAGGGRRPVEQGSLGRLL